MAAFGRGEISAGELEQLQDGRSATRSSGSRPPGSPVISDGEQTKSSFATYPLEGLGNLAPDGAVIPFADGHTRQLPRLTGGPFRFGRHADGYLEAAQRYAHVPVKQAVIAASALSLIYRRTASRATGGTPSSRTSSTRARRTSGGRSTGARTGCRSTSPRGACR
jgi:5-methyltetrahydropteroyltriglutamate--homocysteine methyltransferase